MERPNQQKARDQSAEGKPFPMAAQHRPRKPDKDHGEPAHERSRVKTVFGEPVFALIEPHALECGSHNDEQQDDLNACQRPKQALVGRVLLAEQPMSKKQEGKHQRCNRDEFEEAAPGVLGVGETRSDSHQRGAAKEVMNLHQHEGEEEQVEQPQGDAYFDDAQPRRRQLKSRGKIPFASDRCSTQESGNNPGEECRQNAVSQQAEEVHAEHTRDDAAKYGVRAHEESAEKQEQGETNGKPASDGQGPPGGLTVENLSPPDAAEDEQRGAQCDVESRHDSRSGVLDDLRRDKATSLRAQHEKRKRNQDGQKVEQLQGDRVVPRERRRENDDGSEQPSASSQTFLSRANGHG